MQTNASLRLSRGATASARGRPTFFSFFAPARHRDLGSVPAPPRGAPHALDGKARTGEKVKQKGNTAKGRKAKANRPIIKEIIGKRIIYAYKNYKQMYQYLHLAAYDLRSGQLYDLYNRNYANRNHAKKNYNQ